MARGPIGKHPTLRRRSRQAGFRTLPAVAEGTAPAWPLAPDASFSAQREALRDKLARDQAAIAEASERVGLSSTERARLRRARLAFDRDQLALAVLEAQLEQHRDLEAEFWADLWRAPQAAIWRENPATVRELAHYVRWMLKAADGDAKASAEARQLSDRLGINPAALLRLRADIENVAEAEERGRRRRGQHPHDAEAPDPEGHANAQGTDPRRGLFIVPDAPA